MSTPRILRVGEELPPMDTPSNGQPRPRGERGGGKGKSKGERFRTINNFADWSLAQLNRVEIAVWLLLWRDTKDGIARTSQTDLARRAGATDRTVRRALTRLQKLGLLAVVVRGNLLRGASQYRVFPLIKEKR